MKHRNSKPSEAAEARWEARCRTFNVHPRKVDNSDEIAAQQEANGLFGGRVLAAHADWHKSRLANSGHHAVQLAETSEGIV